MTVQAFVSSFTPILTNSGAVNASGTLEFYSPGTAFATTKAVYSDSSLATSLGATATLDSAGRKTIFLDGNYDLKIKDSTGSVLVTLYNINPDTTSTSTDPNIILNGSFENSTNGVPDSWTLTDYNSGANAVDSSVQYHGKYSMKFVSTGSGGGYITTTAFFPVSLDRQLKLKFAYKSSVADVRNVVEVLWYDKDQVAFSTPSTTLMDDSTTNPTSFTQKTYQVVPLSGTYFAKLRFTGCHSSDATSGNTWFDGISLVEETTEAGTMVPYGNATAPSGWLSCDGTAVSRTTYARLFTAIGTTFGVGDGSTTFNVPDIRGRAPIGSGTGSGLTARTLAATVGAETHTLSAAESGVGAHTHATVAGSQYPNTSPAAAVANEVTGGGGGGLAASAGHNNMQPSLVMHFIIKT